MKLPPGNVSVQQSGSEWKISGDDQPNAIDVTPLSNGSIRISGGASDGGTTTVNKKAYVDIRAGGIVSISMGGGNDRVHLTGSSTSKLKLPAALNVNLGSGVDTFQTNNVVVTGAVRIDTGSESKLNGYEGVALMSSDFGSLTYESGRSVGSNNFSLTGSTVRGSVSVNGTNASNGIVFGSDTIQGSLSIRAGNEDNKSTMGDSLSLNTLTVSGSITVAVGDGRGGANISSVTASSIDVSFGGYTSDSVTVIKCRFGQAKFNGGGGNADSISGHDNTFTNKPSISNFERNTLKL